MSAQKKIEEVNRSLNAQKGHLTRAIKRAEALIDIFKNQTTKETEDELKAESVTVQDHLVKIIELFEKLHELNTDTDQAGELVTKQAEQETRVDELLDKINEAQVNAAKKAGTPVTSVSSQETATKCKVVTALKPELLQLDDSPAKLRVWKQDFKTYFNESNMTRSSQEAQHAYFLACLSTTLKDKVRNLIDYLPVFSADTTAKTCFTVLDEISLQVFPLVKRRQQYFELKQHAGQKTSEYLEKLLVLSREAEIEKLTADDHMVFRCLQGMNSSQNELKQKILEVQNLTLEILKQKVNAQEAAQSCLESLNPSQFSANKGLANGANKNQPKQQNKCDRCNRNHLKKDCTLPTDIICHNCKGKGHISPACRDLKTQSDNDKGAGPASKEDESEEDPESPKKVQGVRLKGARQLTVMRVSAFAVKKPVTQQTPRIDVKVTSEGAEMLTRPGLPDTGADINLMSNDWAKEQGLLLDKTDKISCVAADGEPLKILGSAMAQLDFEGQSALTKIYVSPSMKREFLISRDTLKKLRVIHEDFPHVLPEVWAGAANQERRRLRDKAKDHHDKRAYTLSPASVGMPVWIQDPSSKRWNISGVIKTITRNGRTYLLELDNGRQYWRNRKFVRPKSTSNKDKNP